MVQLLLPIHSVMRWLVLLSLAYSIYRSYKGYTSNAVFSKTEDRVRHWTATISHVQLAIGITLYTQSTVIKYFWSNANEAMMDGDLVFFGLIHISVMLVAIVFITIGSAKAKRLQTDRDKFRTLLVWYVVSLTLILLAIPWPFSPIAARPYIR